MTDKELDELFQQSFSDHRMPVPEDMWQRVNSKKEKERGVAFWWWSGLGVAALLLAGVFVWWNDNPSTTKTAATEVVSSSQNIKTPSVKRSDSSSQSSSSGVISGGKSEASSFTSESSATNLKSSSTQNAGQENTTQFSHKRKRREQPDISAIKDDSVIAANKQQPGETVTAERRAASKTPDSESRETEEKTANQTLLKPNDSAAFAINNKPEKVDSIASKMETSMVSVHPHKQHKVNIEGMIAGYIGDRNIYSVTKEMPTFFVSMTNPQAKAMVRSYSFTVRIEKPLTNHLSLKTGLQFLQTRQNITFNAESVNQSAVINTFGVSSDTARFTQISLRRPLLKSIYNSFTLPLLISYQTTGKKFSIGASGGVLLNLFSWYQGEVPDGNYKSSIAAKQAFRPNAGSSLYASLHVAKSFGNWQLFAEPQLQYSLSSLTKKSASFRQKMTYYGLGIGIKKSIGK